MKIWMFNHYATNMYYDAAGRHHSLAKYLIKRGHEVTIFCANTIHGREDYIEIPEGKFVEKEGPDGVNYVFVKTVLYAGNGLSRIKNMCQFYSNLIKVAKIKHEEEKPDIILASSVHPLTLIAGIKTAKKLRVPCICEVRDLWPETLVELNIISRGNIITRLMYRGEKWIYRKADMMIFTMPGGQKYIQDRNWQDVVKLEKVYHINNGVDLDKFKSDIERFKIEDEDLENENIFKLIYAGSVRAANKIDEFVELADIMKAENKDNIKIIVFGDGDQRIRLQQKAESAGLNNIVFKGRVNKEYIPYILSKGDLNIVTDESNNLGQYGISWNKIFEYMASGKPTVVNYNMGMYNLVEENNFGIAKEYDSVRAYYNDIMKMVELPEEEYNKYAENAGIAAGIYDYKNLAEKLESIMMSGIEKYKIMH